MLIGTLLYSVIVSIHAPREGCDQTVRFGSATDSKFQFTHPGRGATYFLSVGSDAVTRFQFTHPGRGATRIKRKKLNDYKFQFTHPGRGAT